MNNIIDLFFELYEDDRLNVNWKSNNPSFRFKNEILPINNILNIINESNGKDKKDESDLVSEDELVNYIFIIINNMLNIYYDRTDNIDETDKYIQTIINNTIKDELKEAIENDIFLDNNIQGNRLNIIQTEIMTKRDEDEVEKINGYTSKITLETVDSHKEITQFNIELKKTELENFIDKLSKLNDDMNILLDK